MALEMERQKKVENKDSCVKCFKNAIFFPCELEIPSSIIKKNKVWRKRANFNPLFSC